MDGEWDRDGYEVLGGAADAAAIARYAEQRAAARDRLRTREPGGDVVLGGDGGALDPYVEARDTLELLLAGPVVARLRERLGAAPLLFEAAEAAAGAPDEGPYRDATYTGLDDADAPLVTLVVAVGEAAVAVHPGSQGLELPRFSGRFRHHNAERDGAAALAEHRTAMREGAGAPQEIALAAGDVLLLHGDVAHGPVRGAALVGHCCPVTAAPAWFAYRPERAARVPHGDAWYASIHADLRDEPGATQRVPAPPAPPARAPDASRVQEHLQQPGRRGAGLVGRVRGVMGRRPPR